MILNLLSPLNNSAFAFIGIEKFRCKIKLKHCDSRPRSIILIGRVKVNAHTHRHTASTTEAVDVKAPEPTLWYAARALHLKGLNEIIQLRS